MPWILDIRTLDVGQGEASVVVATDPTLPAQRSFLIDGAHASYGRIIHTYMTAAAGAGLPGPPSLMIVSHYDVDHSGGVMALLRADNLWHCCDALAAVAANAGAWPARAQQVAAAAAGAAAAAWGAFGGNAAAAGAPAFAAQHGSAGMNDADAATLGVDSAVQFRPYVNPPNTPLFPVTGSRVSTAAKAAGVACANGIALGHAGPALVADIRAALRTNLQRGLPAVSQFDTGGIYQNATVLDIGNTAHIPAQYTNILGGGFLFSGNFNVVGTGINRQRITPNLGDEVLFNTGPGAAPPPAAAPAAVVVAVLAQAWRGVGVAPANVVSNERENDDSIALVVRFDQFKFFTGGDLPRQGEDPIAAALVGHGLPDPNGGTYPVLAGIPCDKCGHHGAATSTSQNYLNSAVPAGAIISCGPRGRHGHPADATVNRLHGQGSVAFFYLTNDGVANVNVARTQGNNQLTAVGNNSRVAGDNNANNLNAGRNRGDIHLSITQAQAAAGVRRYDVNYWDQDTVGGAGLRTEPTFF